jgi:hypothetical protein
LLIINRQACRRSFGFARVTSVVLCLCLWNPSDVLGQEPQDKKPPKSEQQPEDTPDPMENARRPYRAYFGGATIERLVPNGLDLTGSAFEVYDQNLLADISSPDTSSALGIGGAYTNLIGDLNFARRASGIQTSATGGLNARYYTSLNKFVAADYHAGFGLSRASPITTVEVNQTISYSPVFLLGLFVDALPLGLGDVQRPGTDFAVTDDRAVTAATSAEVARRFSVRTQAIFNGGFRRSHYLVVSPRGTDFSTLEGGGSLRYRVTEDADLRFGYNYRRASYTGTEAFGPFPRQPDEHNINVGLAYNPVLSGSRRTILTFEGGTALVNAPVSSNIFESRRQLRLIADAALAHQMGRTWLLVGSFKRGTGFVEGLSGPVFTDAVSASTNGFFNNRTDLHAAFAHSNGEPTLVGAVTSFSTTTANARVRFALSARWAVAAEYLFYFYDFSKTLQLAPGINPRFKRNSVRGGLTLWLPIHRP